MKSDDLFRAELLVVDLWRDVESRTYIFVDPFSYLMGARAAFPWGEPAYNLLTEALEQCRAMTFYSEPGSPWASTLGG